MERVPRARVLDREKMPTDAEPEAEMPRNKAGAARVPAEGRTGEPVRVPAVAREEAKAATEVHDQFIGALSRKWLAKRL